jgi:hypothetical protein
MKKTFLSDFLFVFSFLLIFSCANAQKPEKGNKGSKNNSIFLKGAAATQDESYSHIVSNVARLKAMLTGSFVQYNTAGDTTGTKYKVWEVNDGKDSVVIYQLPVGDFQKVGHWMYQCQVMTSLPDEPIYQAFTKLVEINRDSIQEFYYDAPSDFEISLDELLTNPEALFAKINLSQLKASKDPEFITYVRKTPLHFSGRSSLAPNPQDKEGFKIILYEVKPQKIEMMIGLSGKDKKFRGSRFPEHINKLAMMKSDAPK